MPRWGSLSVAVTLIFFLVTGCDDPPAAEGVVAPEVDYADRVIAVCEASLTRTDCACFWKKARPAFTKANVGPILQALAERNAFGPAITRVRLEKVAGEENHRIIRRALYECVKM